MTCPSCRAPNPDAQPCCAQCGARLAAADGSDAAPTRTAPQPPDALDTGTTFAGRYQIIEELGRGGMGRVYKVIDQEVHAKVALKLIRPEIAADQPTIDRFRQELTTARGISHKNICRMYDLGRHGATYFLTMEYVAGEDLKSMIAMSGQLGVGTAISIAKQVCDGLAEAHRLGVIHRDLKPQNIQIDKGGHAKIMDFGIARSVRGKGLTDAGIAIGTSQYMSPEQADARDVDARSDLYALGVILYEMLTGRVPFDGDTPLAVAMKHKLEAPRDPRELNASIPADLVALILKCLEKEQANRYQSAGDVHEELVRVEQGLPTTAQVVPQARPSTSKAITVQFTLRQLRVPALVLAAFAVVAFGAWWLWPEQAPTVASPSGKPSIAVLYCENNSGDPALNRWRTDLPELLITSLSQSLLLDVVSSESMFTTLTNLKLADAKRFTTNDLTAVAREVRAQYLLTCSVVKAGPSTIITTKLQSAATGAAVRPPKRIELQDEDTSSKVDELAKEIKADLNLPSEAVAGDSSQPLGQVLTSSPEALKYYTEARQRHLAVAYRDALPLYQLAVDADPSFAMAYRGLAACYSNLGQKAKEAAAAKKALELSEHLPDRFKYQVQITAYSVSSSTYPQAMDACDRLLATHTDDAFALIYKSILLCAADEFAACAEVREKSVRVTPDFIAVSNLASSYSYLGRYDKATALLEAFVERDPKHASARRSLGSAYLFSGQLSEAQRESDTTLLLEPRAASALRLKGNVALLRGDFAASERTYLSSMEQANEADQREARIRLGLLCLTQGRLDKARDQVRASIAAGTTSDRMGWVELEAGRPDLAATTFQGHLANPLVASDLRATLNALSGLGLSYVAQGDVARARQTLADLKARPEGMFGKTKERVSLLVSGALATKLGDGRTAVAELERAVAMWPYPFDLSGRRAGALDLLAQAYELAGDLPKARETYEKITALTAGRLAWGATWARSFYHLGLIAGKQGDKARAREQFGRFLEIWKEADPGLPELSDARKRLAQ